MASVWDAGSEELGELDDFQGQFTGSLQIGGVRLPLRYQG
jgi:hypothetical protein